MRKIISMALIVAIAFTMILVPTVSNAAINLKNPFSASENAGLFGKNADEEAKAMKTDGSSNAILYFSEFNDANDKFNFVDSTYLFVDMNICPDTKATSTVSFGPNAKLYAWNAAGSTFEANRWTNVRIVVKDKTKAEIESTKSSQEYTVYVNGEKVYGPTEFKHGSLTTDMCAGFRFSFRYNSNASVYLGDYIADVALTESNVNQAPVMPVLTAGDDFVVNADSITIKYGKEITVQDIKDANPGADVKVFSDSASLKTAVAANAVVKEGYTVVLAKDKMYSYYDVDVAPQKYDLITATPNFAANNGTTSQIATEVFGRTSSDLKRVTIGSSTSAVNNNFSQLNWSKPKALSNYVVYTLDMAPTEGITSFKVGKDKNTSISANAYVNSQFKMNEWNNIKFIYNIANDTSDLYINDVLVSQGYKSNFCTGNCIRFIIEGIPGSQVYIDKMRAFEWTPSEYAVDADGAYIYEHHDYNGLSGNYWSNSPALSSTVGTYSGDTAIMVKTTGTTDVYKYVGMGSARFGTEKYVVYQIDVKFGPNGIEFKIGTDGHRDVSKEISPSNPKIKKDDWNRIVAVTDAYTGVTKVYINGMYDEASSCTTTLIRTSTSALRIIGYAKDAKNSTDAVVSFLSISSKDKRTTLYTQIEKI